MKRVGVLLVLALVGGGIATALVMSGGDSGDPARSTAEPTGLIDRALSTPDPSLSPTPTPAPAQARRSSGSSQAAPADVGSTDRRSAPPSDELPEGPFSSVEGAFDGPSTGEEPDDGERDFEAECANEDNQTERDRCESDLEAEVDAEENEAEAEEDENEAERE